jgi:hypothetical protein
MFAHIPATRCPENNGFLIYNEATLESRGARCEKIGNNVLVLRGGGEGVVFAHVLVLCVEERQRMRLLVSDGVVLEPAVDVQREDLIHFVLRYHHRPEISPVRFFRTLDSDPVEGTFENYPGSPRGGTRNPRRVWHDADANPEAGGGWARYRNPPSTVVPRRSYRQRTPGETPRLTDGSRGNPAGRSSDDGGNPGSLACVALERAVDCIWSG